MGSCCVCFCTQGALAFFRMGASTTPCNLSCPIRWLIYLMGIMTVVMAIAVFAIDQHEKTGAKHTGTNIGLFVFMLACALPVLLHYLCSRLVFIALMVIVCARKLRADASYRYTVSPFLTLDLVFMITRAFLAEKYRPKLIWPVFTNAIAGCLYFWVVSFYIDRGPDESSWKTFTKPNSDVNSSALPGSSAPGSSAPGSTALPGSSAPSSSVPKSKKKKTSKPTSRR